MPYIATQPIAHIPNLLRGFTNPLHNISVLPWLLFLLSVSGLAQKSLVRRFQTKDLRGKRRRTLLYAVLPWAEVLCVDNSKQEYEARYGVVESSSSSSAYATREKQSRVEKKQEEAQRELRAARQDVQEVPEHVSWRHSVGECRFSEEAPPPRYEDVVQQGARLKRDFRPLSSRPASSLNFICDMQLLDVQAHGSAIDHQQGQYQPNLEWSQGHPLPGEMGPASSQHPGL
ncbi:hypothetical protein IAQ61_004788 [Plenodomus lingam]|uniref:uncharacterized protein n=1 Tax=Leptosphaeria maculans TaxID=5022 RepID=UPI00331AF3BE|nr:hypothetical protein IAQ61_004788 [Plenodomus lingam]